MFKQTRAKNHKPSLYFLRGGISLTLLFLLIEFFDELHYGVSNAALPALRTTLELSYAQVGILLGLPGVINAFIEPFLMLLGDTGLRRRLVISGGLVISVALVIVASAKGFPLLLLAAIIAHPASGAFVTLAQATLMDIHPGREPHMMARWTLSGSIANLIGPLLIAAGFALGWGWRWAYAGLALFCLGLVLVVIPRPFPKKGQSSNAEPKPEGALQSQGIAPSDHPATGGGALATAKELLRGLWEALRNPRLLRWVILLQLSDLLLDVLYGYLPLYFTDVMRLTPTQTSILISVLMLAGLASDVALIPLLERVQGRTLVRLSAGITAVLYIGWLLVPGIAAQIALIVLIKLVTLGWYSVLQGEAYAAGNGRSGTVMALTSLLGLLGGVMVWGVGYLANQLGLSTAMWLLLLGPISLALFVPSARKR
jgi:FSR family fosmidomycin resistance protein-like MFS transporter